MEEEEKAKRESIQDRGKRNSPWRQTTAACTSNPYSSGYTEGGVTCHVNPDIKERRTNKTEVVKGVISS